MCKFILIEFYIFVIIASILEKIVSQTLIAVYSPFQWKDEIILGIKFTKK